MNDPLHLVYFVASSFLIGERHALADCRDGMDLKK